MKAHMPLCCMGCHHWLPGTLAQGEGISPKSALHLYKSGSAEGPSRPICAQCEAIQTTEMHPGGVNQMHRLVWEATLSPALCTRQSSAQPPPACSCSSKCFSSKGWCLHILPASPSSQSQENSSGAAQESLGIREGMC